MIHDTFLIPTVNKLFDELHDSSFYTKLGLRLGFHQIRVSPTSIEAITFCTSNKHYKFNVMLFGLTNALSTCQATMNFVFKQYLRKFFLIFFNDILAYIPDFMIHLEHLKKNQFYVK